MITKIYKKYSNNITIYITNILKYEMFVQWQKVTKISLLGQQETKNIHWDCFRKTEQKHGFTTELLETTMSEWTLPIWQKFEEEIIYKYSLRFKEL